MVRFGIGRRWVIRRAAGGIPCGNRAFGGDPAPNIPKVCEVQVRTTQSFPPPQQQHGGRGEFCAREGGWCQFRGTRRVLYGAHGRFVERVVRGGR